MAGTSFITFTEIASSDLKISKGKLSCVWLQSIHSKYDGYSMTAQSGRRRNWFYDIKNMPRSLGHFIMDIINVLILSFLFLHQVRSKGTGNE